MKEKIDYSLLDEFRANFDQIKDNELQKKTLNNAILDICLNQKIKEENKFEFNLELEDCKIYNQYSSKRCWMFAVLNFIKNDMAHNLNQATTTFELSTNYLNFYDKLEKANHAYQTIIELDLDNEEFKLCDYDDHPILTGYLKDPVRENGKAVFTRSLLKKYGIVPMCIMPETANSMCSEDLNNWFTRKIRFDMLKLIELKKQEKNIKNIYETKNIMLSECYTFLAYFLGEPPKSFNYSYSNESGQEIKLLNQSPLDFYNNYCKINLDDYIQISQLPSFEYYKKFEKRYTQNIVEYEAFNFVNIPQEEFTNLCLTQLKNNIPVVIGCDNRKYRDKESKILDTRIFDFEKLFGLKDMSKKECLQTFDCRSRHLMTIRGVHIDNDKPIRWKIEDSYGEDNRIQGYYVMNHNYFEKCVFYALINKKFLPGKVLKILDTTPIIYGYEGSEL